MAKIDFEQIGDDLASNHKLITMITTTILYLGLFQCLFLVIPVNWFVILNFRVELLWSASTIELFFFLLIPAPVVLFLIPLLKKKVFSEEKITEVIEEGVAKSNYPSKTIFSEKEWT